MAHQNHEEEKNTSVFFESPKSVSIGIKDFTGADFSVNFQ